MEPVKARPHVGLKRIGHSGCNGEAHQNRARTEITRIEIDKVLVKECGWTVRLEPLQIIVSHLQVSVDIASAYYNGALFIVAINHGVVDVSDFTLFRCRAHFRE